MSLWRLLLYFFFQNKSKCPPTCAAAHFTPAYQNLTVLLISQPQHVRLCLRYLAGK